MVVLTPEDYEDVAEQLLRISELRPGADPDGFRAAIGELVEEVAYGREGMRILCMEDDRRRRTAPEQ